jgi:hypothetical protein
MCVCIYTHATQPFVADQLEYSNWSPPKIPTGTDGSLLTQSVGGKAGDIVFVLTATLLVCRMSDLMWGGVPFQIPSSTALKYLGKAVKVKVGTRAMMLQFCSRHYLQYHV